MTKLVALLGSVTPPGRLRSAVSGALERAAAAGADTVLLDLGEISLGYADGRPVEQLTDDTLRLVAELSAADAVLIASPVYRASITGALKNALDLVPVEALQGKPVAVVTMGATLHHYLGAESHLRDVLAWFGALTLPTAVYLSSGDFVDGVLTDEAAASLDGLLASAVALSSVTAAVRLEPNPLAAAVARRR